LEELLLEAVGKTENRERLKSELAGEAEESPMAKAQSALKPATATEPNGTKSLLDQISIKSVTGRSLRQT